MSCTQKLSMASILAAVLMTAWIALPASADGACNSLAATIFKKDPTDDTDNTWVVNGVDVTFSRWDKDSSGTIGSTEGWIIDGTGNADVIVGSDKDDLIHGSFGADTICAGDGDDEVRGGQEKNSTGDTIFGENGNDLILGGWGDDTLNGGDGDDQLYGGQNDDTLDGGGEITGDICDAGRGQVSGTVSNCEA